MFPLSIGLISGCCLGIEAVGNNYPEEEDDWKWVIVIDLFILRFMIFSD